MKTLDMTDRWTKTAIVLVASSLLFGCSSMPDYPEGSIRHYVWTNLGKPHATAVTDSGIEGWYFKQYQAIGFSICKSFTVWFDREFAFLLEPIQSSSDKAFCRSKEDVDLEQYSQDLPRSPLNLLPKGYIEIRS